MNRDQKLFTITYDILIEHAQITGNKHFRKRGRRKIFWSHQYDLDEHRITPEALKGDRRTHFFLITRPQSLLRAVRSRMQVIHLDQRKGVSDIEDAFVRQFLEGDLEAHEIILPLTKAKTGDKSRGKGRREDISRVS